MSATVRHWPRGYQHNHEGADTITALKTALTCHSIVMNDVTIRMMAVQLEIKGQSTYIGDADNYIFRLVDA